MRSQEYYSKILTRTVSFLIAAYVITSPFYFLRLGTNVVPTDFIGGLLVISWSVYIILIDRKINTHPILLIATVLSITSMASSIYSTFVSEAIFSGLLLLNLSVISIIIYDWIISKNSEIKYIIQLLRLWVIGAIITTIVIFAGEFKTVGIQAIAPSYSYNQRTQLPYLLVVAAISSLYLYKYSIERKQIYAGIRWALLYQFSIFTIIISISRGPWVALIGVLFPAFLFHADIRRYIIQLNIPGLTVGLVTAVYFGQVQRIIDRATSIFQPNDSETAGRFEIYANAIDVTFANPLIGVGWNNYSEIFNIAGSAHSTYLTISSELGVFALLLYLLIPVLISRNWTTIVASRNISPKKKCLYLAPLTGLLGLLVGQTFSTAILWYRAFWVLLAFSVVVITLAAQANRL